MFQRLNENKDLIIVAIASFFIGFGAASFFGGDAPAPVAQENETESLPQLPFEEGENEAKANGDAAEDGSADNAAAPPDRVETIRVENQRAGLFVRVQHAELAEARWIVVRELNADGTAGNILGAGWQPAGVHNDIEVKLLRETIGGEQYRVVLFTDVNADKAFDHTADAPTEISTAFTTVASPDGS